MFAGSLILSTIIGLASGITAFSMGLSAWMALLVYCGAGSLSFLVLLFAGYLVGRAARKETFVAGGRLGSPSIAPGRQ